MWYAYILKSLKSGNCYVGSTNDLRRRFREHDDGIGGKYTHNNRPFKLIFYEAYLNKKDVEEAERFFKTGYGREVLKGKIKNYLLENKN